MHGVRNSKNKSRTNIWVEEDKLERKAQKARSGRNRRSSRVEIMKLRGELNDMSIDM